MSGNSKAAGKTKKDDDLIEVVEEENTFEFSQEINNDEVAVTKPGPLARERRTRGPGGRAVTSPDEQFFDIV